jgi:RNA polymerase sigma-70 factor, ECF subfamily
MAERDTAMTVEAALSALPVEQRAAITLVDIEGYSVADTASILGVAEGTVKSRCARGRARLAIALGHLRNLDRDAAVPEGSGATRSGVGRRFDGS